MNQWLLNLIYFIIVFGIVFCGDYFFIKKPNITQKKKKNSKKTKKVKKEKKNKEIFELDYVVAKFKLDKRKVPVKKCAIHFALLNAFIISATVTVITRLFDRLFIAWQFLIGFVMLVGLIYAVYELYGRYCIKKGWQKNEL